MSAVPEALDARVPPLEVQESRDFRSYHAFLRAARNYMEGPLLVQAFDRYEKETTAPGAKPPADWREAEVVLDRGIDYQLYNWYYRNLQRFKYHRPDFGIFATVEAQRARLEAALDDAARATPPAQLRLNPDLLLPDYFRYVPFHQHTGGVVHDPLDGISYEIGRRTTVPSHADPNGIYRLLFEAIVAQGGGRRYARVLDWGTGHGAALLTWQGLHPESECHGVDLSAPCLRLANLRAREQGRTLFLSQQDLEHLDYPDGHFDLIFFNFMLHELAPAHMPALLREACRVLRPGGLFAGHEFHLRPGDLFQNVLQRLHALANNEPYATPWYELPIEQIGRAAGFARVRVLPFEALNRSTQRPGRSAPNTSHWNLYFFEK